MNIRLFFLRRALARADRNYTRAVAKYSAGQPYRVVEKAAKRYGDINNRINQIEMYRRAYGTQAKK